MKLIELEVPPVPGEQSRPQGHIGETHPDQPTHAVADRFPQPPHLPLAAFANHHRVPPVKAAPPSLLNGGEARGPILKLDTRGQPLNGFGRHLTYDAHGIFPFDLLTRVHQAIGQLSVGGYQ